jgi:cell division protein FtsI (penicillin-binding protein 3)
VVYVMMDEPHYPYYGGEAAGPVFRRIMTAALAREGVSPDPKLIPLEIGKRAERREDKVRTVASAAVPPEGLKEADDSWLMPELDGLTARDVLDLFSQKNIKLRVRGSGLVTSQWPRAGALLKRGQEVRVRLEREAILP